MKTFTNSPIQKSKLLFLLFTFATLSTYAQSVAERLSKVLVAAGYENVRVVHLNDTTCINIENYSFRWNVEAISKVWSIIDMGFTTSNTVILSLSELNQPKLFFTFNKTGTERKYHLLKTSDHLKINDNIQQQSETFNAGKNKLQIHLLPEVSSSHCPLNKFYGVIWFSPVFESTFWNGGRLLIQPRFQLLNTDRYEGQKIALGYFTLEQQFKIKNIHNQFNAGYFSSSRYGTQLSIKRYFFNGKLTLIAKAAFTGELYFDGFTPFYTSLSTFTWSGAFQYFFKPYNMQLEYEFEKTLNGTLARTFSFHRHFNETTVGFYGILFEGKSIAGFYVDIPLGKKYRTTSQKRISIQIPKYWGIAYIGKYESGYGSQLSTTPLSTVTWKNYNPCYFNNFLKNKSNETTR